MRVTFEGRTIIDVMVQMESMLAAIAVKDASERHAPKAPPTVDAPKSMPEYIFEAPGSDTATAVDTPVDTPVDVLGEKPAKPRAKRERSEKQRENDEKLRVAAKAKVAAKKAAKATVDTALGMPMPPPPKSAEGMDPAEVVRIRQKTIEELQAAYANGFQNEVLELLSRFGNGAKSFRELTPDAFVPIREAIDNGALT